MKDGKFLNAPKDGVRCFHMSYMDGAFQHFSEVSVKNAPHSITVGTLQMFLDDYLKNNPGVKIDYLHGTESILRD